MRTRSVFTRGRGQLGRGTVVAFLAVMAAMGTVLAACQRPALDRFALVRGDVSMPMPEVKVEAAQILAPPPAPQPDPVPQCSGPVLPTTGSGLVAAAAVPRVPVFDAPGGQVVKMLSNPNQFRGPLVFLVYTTRADGWAQVYLPTRPNGALGWIRQSDVSITPDDYRIQVELGAHRLTAWKGGQMIVQAPVAVGTGGTPTPCGQFFIEVLGITPNPSGAYGPYIYGLSAHSDVLQTFAGGDGMIGIHGTNAPSLIGGNVSHGCIRMHNADITRLVQQVPIGSPVLIVP